MSDGPYARLYLSLVDDLKFSTIYDDDRHFAAWCRLLMIAEPAWPASAHLPALVRRSSIKALTDAGLIDLQPGGRYRVHGLDAEREGRHQHAQRASNARWNAPSNAQAMPRARAEPNRTEPNQAEPRAEHGLATADEKDDLWALYGGLTRTIRPSPNVLEWLTRLEDNHGAIPAAAALRAEFEADPSRKTLLSRTEKRLEGAARTSEKEAESSVRSRRIVDGMMARRVETFRWTGDWDEAWGPKPVPA